MSDGLFTFVFLAGAIPAIVVVVYAVIQFGAGFADNRQGRLADQRRRQDSRVGVYRKGA